MRVKAAALKAAITRLCSVFMVGKPMRGKAVRFGPGAPLAWFMGWPFIF
jgi:hypothetical protein